MGRSWMRPALLVLLALSLAGNVYLAVTALGTHRLLCLERVGLLPAALPADHYPPADIIYLGDSRIASWAPLPAIPGLSATNAGVGGETTAKVLERLDRDVLQRNPQVVVLQVGVNDLKAIGMFPEHAERVLQACETNIRRIVALVVGSGAKVLLLTVLPAGHSVLRRASLWSDDVDASLGRLNAGLLELASEAVVVVDCARELGSGGRLPNAYADGFLHLNARGYERLSDVVRVPLEDLVSR